MYMNQLFSSLDFSLFLHTYISSLSCEFVVLWICWERGGLHVHHNCSYFVYAVTDMMGLILSFQYLFSLCSSYGRFLTFFANVLSDAFG